MKPENCPRGTGKKIQILQNHRKTIEDIQIIKVVTKFHYYNCFCEKCNKKFVTSSAQLPKKGLFGPVVSSLWTILHYVGTTPFDRLSLIMYAYILKVKDNKDENTAKVKHWIWQSKGKKQFRV